jgi:uncharacterized membrane protein YiaA
VQKIIKKITDFLFSVFSDNGGRLSSMRILSAFAIVVPILVWTVYVFVNEWQDFNESFALLILGALGSKAAQKWAESKNGSTKSNSTNKEVPPEFNVSSDKKE